MTYRRLHPVAVVGVDRIQVGFERPAEVDRIDPVDAMELVAPLHRAGSQVPQPAAHVRQGFALPHACLHLGERGLRQALLGDVPRDHDGAHELAAGTVDRAQRQRDRYGHAVLAQDLRLEVAHPVTRPDGVEDRLDIGAEVVWEQADGVLADDLGPAVAEAPLGGTVPTRDLAAGVLAVDRVVGRLQDRNEERVGSLTAGPRVVVAPVLRSAARGHLPCMFPDHILPPRRPASPSASDGL